MQGSVCCFIGHREIKESEELRLIIENLIVNRGVDTFLFGSKSKFNSLCYRQVSRIREKYPHIKRIYVRAEFPYLDEAYKAYLLKYYEHSYYPSKINGAGKAVYVERNFHMIDESHFCVMYFREDYTAKGRKSGTKIALEYATKKKKEVLLVT